MKNILVVGGSFGGLTAAFELRKRLGPDQAQITVLSKSRRFTFIPALIWVALGETSVEAMSLDLAGPLQSRGIRFVEGSMTGLDPVAKLLQSDQGPLSYDYLLLATGHRSADEAVPGLGPDGGAHSVMSPAEAAAAHAAFQAFLAAPGPIVVGCAPGASCIGPAYEFALEVDHYLRKKKLRHKVPIHFVTPEPYLGHFGVGGIGGRQFLEAEFEKRDIRYQLSAAITRVSPGKVELADGQALDSSYSIIIPPLAGVAAVAATAGLANPKGFIPVDPHYRHKDFPSIYAVGVAVALPPAETTPVPVNFPKTGHMTEQMARLAAHNISAEILGGAPKAKDLDVVCLMDLGDRAAYIAAEPVRPPRNKTSFSQGRHWLWAKKFFARYYLWSLKRGRVPEVKWVW